MPPDPYGWDFGKGRCAPVFASGSIVTVPAHSRDAPTLVAETAAARSIPGV